MKVELDIKDDSELRNVIKDMIRGQVTSLVRDEVREMVKSITEEQVKSTVTTELQRIVPDTIRSLNRAYSSSQSTLDKMVKEAITTHVKTVTDTEMEDRIFHKALELLSRDNKAIEALCQRFVDESMKKFFQKTLGS